MASNFPTLIDSFINPVYNKVNGIDYVKAEHINDLQDAVKNIQILLIGAGLSMNLESNNYLPEDSSVKNALEILDGVIKAHKDAYDDHTEFVMPTDPFQHHANVIQVTAIGNLNSTRGQQALEEHQADIDGIMSGGYVEGATLDDRYVLKNGASIINGSLTVQNTFEALQDVYLGSTGSHQVVISGSASVGEDLLVSGNAQFDGNITVSNTTKIGAIDSFEYTNIGFLASGMHFKTLQDFVFTLDADDAIDALSTVSKLEIQNGLGTPIFSMGSTGILNLLDKLVCEGADFTSYSRVGNTTLEEDNLDIQNGTFTIKLDSNSDELASELIITRDNDTGVSDTSTNIILKVNEARVITGNHVLKRTIQETGYFGMKFYSDNAGGKFHGIGVNFKTKMTTVPSSVSLAINPIGSSNYSNVSITDITEYGFFIECDSLTIGHVELKGTYTTVGN